jgi:hypothetical protein
VQLKKVHLMISLNLLLMLVRIHKLKMKTEKLPLMLHVKNTQQLLHLLNSMGWHQLNQQI